MPFDFSAINKYLPLIQTGASIAGNYLGGRAQTNALNRAGTINQQATNDAMRAILGLYDEGQGQLAPYRNVGPQALNNLQALTNRGAVPAPASVQTQPTNALARYGPSGPSSLGSAGGIQNAMGPSGQPSSQAASSAAKKGIIGSGIGLGAAGALGAGLGGITALGAIGGPIGMGLAAAGGLVASQFGKNNPYKAAASKGIDEVSRNIWGTNTPGLRPEQLTSGYVHDILTGKVAPEQGKQMIKSDLDAWVAGMRANGTPDDVIQSSIATQKQHLAPLRDIFARMGSQSPV